MHQASTQTRQKSSSRGESSRQSNPLQTQRLPDMVATVRSLVKKDQRETVEHLVAATGLNSGTVDGVLHDGLSLFKEVCLMGNKTILLLGEQKIKSEMCNII